MPQRGIQLLQPQPAESVGRGRAATMPLPRWRFEQAFGFQEAVGRDTVMGLTAWRGHVAHRRKRLARGQPAAGHQARAAP
jgi:hypothetical protein